MPAAEPPEWQPILLGGLFKRFGRDSWGNGPGREEGMREVERRAADYGLPPIRWPDPWPRNTLFAMRAATFAKEIGRDGVVLAGGVSPGVRGRARPRRVATTCCSPRRRPSSTRARWSRPTERDSVKSALREATDRAGDLGVRGVPAVVVDGECLLGRRSPRGSSRGRPLDSERG